MTISISFRCPTCRKQVFHLELQADNSIRWRPWPFSLTCDKCGDIIDSYIEPNGKLNADLPQCDSLEPGKVYAYSNTLPIIENLYYQDRLQLAIPSPFSNILGLGNYNGFIKDVTDYGEYMRIIEEGIVKYKNILSALYPMLKREKTHLAAFRTKLINTMGYKQTEIPEIVSWEQCYGLFHNFHSTIIEAISKYDQTVAPFFTTLFKGLKERSIDDLRKIVESCYGDIQQFDYANDLVNKRLNSTLQELPKLLPAFFLDLLKLRDISADSHLRLVTASIKDIEDLYKNNYNLLVKYLPLVMAVYNYVYNGDVNKFVDDSGTELKYTLADFMKLTDGNRINAMSQLQELKDSMQDAFSHHVRNGIDHVDSTYDNTTQLARYYYDNSDKTKSETCYLIRLANMCVVQLRWLTWICILMWNLERVYK